MFDPVNRRDFLEQTATAAVALQIAGSMTLAGDQAPAGGTAPAGPAVPVDLLSYVDPLVRPAVSTLPDAENALPLLKQAAKLLTALPDGDFENEDCFNPAKPDAGRDRRIAAWLDQNQQAIPLVELAVARGKLEFPTTLWTVDRLPEMHSLHLLAWLLLLQTQRLVAEGKLAEAVKTTRTVCEAFRLLEGGGGFTVESLIAIACEGSAWGMARRIAAHPKADAKFVRALLAALPVRTDPLGSLRRSDQTEFCYFFLPTIAKTEGADLAKTIEIMLGWDEGLESIVPRKTYELQRERLLQLFEGHPKPYDLADTVKRASARSAARIRDLDIPWPTIRDRPDQPLSGELAPWPKGLSLSLDYGDSIVADVTDAQIRAARKKLLRVDNPLGKAYCEAVGEGTEQIYETALRDQARYQATRLFLALRIFALEHGELPADLNTLVDAKIINAIPLDPFSAEQFQYSPAKKLIWSVGPTGKVSPDTADEFDAAHYVWRLDA